MTDERTFRETPRVAVVGSGAAGVSAAHRLQQAGASVLLLEERAWLGGRMRTDRFNGFQVDAGIQLFGSTAREFFRLLAAVGAGAAAVRAPGRDALWRGGRIHEVVYGSMASMIASGAMPLGTKLRMGARYLPFLTRHARDLRLETLARAADAGLDRESIGAWGRRELGADFVEALAAPLLGANFGLDPEETSAALFHMLASEGLDVEVFALRGGAATLAEAAAASLPGKGGEVRTEARVESVELGARGVTLRGEGWEERVDGVVLATPAPTAARLLAGTGSPAAAWLAAVPYTATVSLALALDRTLDARYFGLSLPKDRFPTVGVVCVESNKGVPVAPPGKELLVVFPQPDAGAGLVDAEAGMVVDAFLPELERLYPGLKRRIQRARLYRWPEWNVRFRPGYLGHLRGFGGGAVEGDARFALAGDYLLAPGVEAAVRSGRHAAERILSRLGRFG